MPGSLFILSALRLSDLSVYRRFAVVVAIIWVQWSWLWSLLLPALGAGFVSQALEMLSTASSIYGGYMCPMRSCRNTC